MLAEPLIEVAGVEVDAPVTFDQLGDAWGGPQLGAEAEIPWALGDPPEDGGFLGGPELRSPAMVGDRCQSAFPNQAVQSDPTADGTRVNAEEACHLGLGVAFLHPAHSQEAAAFQFFCGSFASHSFMIGNRPNDPGHSFSESQ